MAEFWRQEHWIFRGLIVAIALTIDRSKLRTVK